MILRDPHDSTCGITRERRSSLSNLRPAGTSGSQIRQYFGCPATHTTQEPPTPSPTPTTSPTNPTISDNPRCPRISNPQIRTHPGLPATRATREPPHTLQPAQPDQETAPSPTSHHHATPATRRYVAISDNPRATPHRNRQPQAHLTQLPAQAALSRRSCSPDRTGIRR